MVGEHDKKDGNFNENDQVNGNKLNYDLITLIKVKY